MICQKQATEGFVQHSIQQNQNLNFGAVHSLSLEILLRWH